MSLTDVSSETNRSKTRRPPRRSHRRSDFIERAKRNVPVRVEYPHPLCWWRTRAAHSFKSSDIAIARCFLRKSAIIGEPRWHLAAQGNAAIAIGVALRIRKQTTNFISVDLAMTAVLCVALEGASAAAFLLASALESRTAIDPQGAALSMGWRSHGQSQCRSRNGAGPRKTPK